MAENRTTAQDTLDPREAAKRQREKLLILGVTVLVVLTTYFEVRLSNLSNRLPFVNSIFFFGLINFNVILLMVLVGLVFRNIGKLFLERRRKILGSRLKAKLVIAFLSFTIIPTVILFLISSLYINASFDKWFSLKVQNTLQATLDITQTYYKNMNRIAQHMASQFSGELREKYGQDKFRPRALKSYVQHNVELPTVDGIEVYTDPLDERVVASTHVENGATVTDPESALPRLPLDVLTKAFAGETVSLVQHMAGSDLIRAVAPIMDRRSGKVYGAVAVTFIIPVSIVNKVDEISSVFQDYRDVNPLKYPMKSTYFIILIMMTLLIIFVSIWIGIYIARELTVPLERLVQATQRIRGGNLDFEVINPGNDEIATLTGSFNDMTAELKRHRVELEATNRALAEKRAYVEAILNNVAGGVISVESNGTIATVNASAAKLLGQASEQLVDRNIAEVFDAATSPLPALFADSVKRAEQGLMTPLRRQFAHGGSQGADSGEEASSELMATATPFGGGIVFVIDDMSNISKAQREAAWREVARRIAHEIKNPLTPIKLSAQRLQKKFASHHSAEAAIFRECTDTIIKNVDELKDMVNEFSEFARFPSANPSPQKLNEALREVVVLYEEAHRSVNFIFQPESRLPLVDVDRDQLKRVVINLLDNAVAALQNGVGSKLPPPKIIKVRTHFNELLRIAAIEIEDNGPGMTDTVRSRLFEPYFSTKTNGTGLGLAIVKRIISDHQGFIRVTSAPGEGTKFTIELPVNLPVNLSDKEFSDVTGKEGSWPELYS
ncbi:MAG: HAMP domain-containing protein [Deltaproteobacteria bacterium]|nr:HAMP domain-containing protein [Deltaproteobacteria bacterium]